MFPYVPIDVSTINVFLRMLPILYTGTYLGETRNKTFYSY